MIARVRIAPVERWCASALLAGAPERGARLVGMEVEIFAASMRLEECRKWLLTDEAVWAMHDKAGTPPHVRARSGHKICEHMLEMD